MTTSKPEVKAWVISAYIPYAGFQRHVCMSEDDAHDSRATFERLKGEVEEVPLINLSDYEALQAECEGLRKVADQYRKLIELGEDFQWENIIRVDIGDFPSRADAIDTAIWGNQLQKVSP